MSYEIHFFSTVRAVKTVEDVDHLDSHDMTTVENNDKASVEAALDKWEHDNPERKVNRKTLQVQHERS
ncbi:MAG: hypothetical protein ABI758_05925 [Candidatus Woesebacteria bacterium]